MLLINNSRYLQFYYPQFACAEEPEGQKLFHMKRGLTEQYKGIGIDKKLLEGCQPLQQFYGKGSVNAE